MIKNSENVKKKSKSIILLLSIKCDNCTLTREFPSKIRIEGPLKMQRLLSMEHVHPMFSVKNSDVKVLG